MPAGRVRGPLCVLKCTLRINLLLNNSALQGNCFIKEPDNGRPFDKAVLLSYQSDCKEKLFKKRAQSSIFQTSLSSPATTGRISIHPRTPLYCCGLSGGKCLNRCSAVCRTTENVTFMLMKRDRKRLNFKRDVKKTWHHLQL